MRGEMRKVEGTQGQKIICVITKALSADGQPLAANCRQV